MISAPRTRADPGAQGPACGWSLERQYDDVNKSAYRLWRRSMQRVTITIDDDLAEELDRFMAARGYANRSEAIRDLARGGLEQRASEAPDDSPCVAALVYVYDHHARDLPKRLTQGFHDHHDIAQATLHVHLDAENCLEVAVLKGRGAQVREFADAVIAERGVRHGHVVIVPGSEDHGHSHTGSHAHGHHHDHPPARARKRR
jgi:CopG family transcriptional regulator, nickel-responsive regulator